MAQVTSNSIANQAIQMIGDNQPPVVGFAPNWDNSAAGKALQQLYTPCVQTAGKTFGWDFTRNTIALALSGQPAPFPWSIQYLYPTNGIEVWQVAPPSLDDPNDPLPVNWDVANAVINSVQQRVINTDLANALAIFNNMPGENSWDVLFREEVVRLLASELAMALMSKPETSAGLFQSSSGFGQIGDERNG